MKRILLTTIAAAGLAAPALFAAELTTFRVCEDKHVLKTSDGADAGRVQYIVVEPEQQRIVSAVITGGVIGQKFVTVPYASVRFSSGNDVVLERIDREHLLSAPVIEERTLTSTTVVEPQLIERSYTHFGFQPNFTVGVDASRSSTTIDRSTTNINAGGDRDRARQQATTDLNQPARQGADRAPAATTDQNQRNRNTPGTTPPATESNRDAQSRRDATTEDRNRAPGSAAPANKPSRSEANAPGAGASSATEPSAASTRKADRTDKAEKTEKADREAAKAEDKTERATSKGEEKADRAQEKATRKSGSSAEEARPGSASSSSTPSASASGTSRESSGSSRSNESSGSTSASGTSGSKASGTGTSGASGSEKEKKSE